jgi:hypothetical protein
MPINIRYTTKIYFCNLLNPYESMEVDYAACQTVRHIRDFIGERLNTNLEDYTLVALINN